MFITIKAFISSNSDEEDIILETQRRQIQGFCAKLISCNCLCFKQEEDVVPWVEQTQNQLQTAFRKCQWKKLILYEMQKFFPESLSRVQQDFINKLKISLTYSDPNQSQMQKSFNIQFETMNEPQSQPNVEIMSQKIDRIHVPSRTYSILEDINENLRNSKYTISKKNSQLYKNAMSIIEQQVVQKNHPINILFAAYIKYFLDQHPPLKDNTSSFIGSKLLEPLYQRNLFRGTFIDSRHKLEQRIESLIEELRTFVGFIALATYSFYQIDHQFTQQLQYFNVYNLSSFALTLLFQENQLYSLIFNCFEILLKDEINQFTQNLQIFQDERPAFFGVPLHLELTDDSVDFLRKGNNQDIVEYQKPQSALEKVEMVDMKSSAEFGGQIYESRIISNMLIKQTSDPKTPYYLAVKQLKTLKTLRSPLHQLKALSSTTDFIQESINEFYHRYKLDLVKNFGADEMVPILCYIITQSKITNLGCYLKNYQMIENFTPTDALNSAAGYKLITLQGCYRQVLQMDLQSTMSKRKSKTLNNIQKDKQEDLEILPSKQLVQSFVIDL